MVFMTAAAIGVTAGLMRSAAAMALIAVLIGLAFAGAALVSPGPVPLLRLLLAIGGYNAGLLGLVAAYLAVDQGKARPQARRM